MPEAIAVTRLQTRRDDLGVSRLDRTALAVPPGAGQAILKIDRFALTANNLTYAAFGDAMNYWDFFPTGEADWGHMPVWGFADVVASAVDGVEPGERFYGYFPAATHIVMQPVRVTPRGFYDGAPHRAELVSAYNQYTRCSTDPAWNHQDEDFQMLLRPLFITSFMLADMLVDNGFFGARRVVFSSASSKTAYGTAFALGGGAGVERIALTSPGSRPFVERLGFYERSIAYGDLETLPSDVPTLYVDFSGDDVLRERIHRHFGPNLVYDCYAGSARNPAFFRDADLPGPKPQFYFAPVQIRKRNADWGAAELTRRIDAAQADFFRTLRERSLLTLEEGRGLDAALSVVAAFHAGRSDPSKGYVIRL